MQYTLERATLFSLSREREESNHRGHRKVPTDGFEVREAHQDLSAPQLTSEQVSCIIATASIGLSS